MVSVSQAEALVEQIRKLQERLSALEIRVAQMGEGCLVLALSGQALEQRMEALEAPPRLILPGGLQ